MVKLDADQLLEAQKEIYQRLENSDENLLHIQLSKDSLIERWQLFLSVILPIQIDVAAKYGFQKDQIGLAHFNKQFMEEAVEGSELYEQNQKKWLFLFEKAFGVTEVKNLTLQEARGIIREISDAMISDDFLNSIDRVMEGVPEDADTLLKRQKLLELLLPLHMSVLAKHGFEGESGYVQAQRALMDYYHDMQVAQTAARAQIVIFRRAGLLNREDA